MRVHLALRHDLAVMREEGEVGLAVRRGALFEVVTLFRILLRSFVLLWVEERRD